MSCGWKGAGKVTRFALAACFAIPSVTRSNAKVVWFPEDDTTGQGDFGPATWFTTGNITLRSGSQSNGPWVLASSAGKRVDICALLG
jgi:hypothetical protein